MNSKSHLKSALLLGAMAAFSNSMYYNIGSKVVVSDKADHSKNIKPYHEKPLRKGAFKKHLSKKQRKNKTTL